MPWCSLTTDHDIMEAVVVQRSAKTGSYEITGTCDLKKVWNSLCSLLRKEQSVVNKAVITLVFICT